MSCSLCTTHFNFAFKIEPPPILGGGSIFLVLVSRSFTRRLKPPINLCHFFRSVQDHTVGPSSRGEINEINLCVGGEVDDAYVVVIVR